MKNNNKIKFSIAIILFQIQSIFAQAPSFNDDVEDVTPAAPIDSWTVPMILIGLGIVYIIFKKRTQLMIKK